MALIIVLLLAVGAFWLSAYILGGIVGLFYSLYIIITGK
ncbi:Uncharacterised protein [Neisseria animalis]|nr:Uncharacterised protein [Neisseria animalis]